MFEIKKIDKDKTYLHKTSMTYVLSRPVPARDCSSCRSPSALFISFTATASPVSKSVAK